MKHPAYAVLLTSITAGLLVVSAPHASATEGRVLVFTTEISKATVYENPTGCTVFPPAAHIVVNQTNTPIKIYAGPSCIGPSIPVESGWGGHISPVPGTNSFLA